MGHYIVELASLGVAVVVAWLKYGRTRLKIGEIEVEVPSFGGVKKLLKAAEELNNLINRRNA